MSGKGERKGERKRERKRVRVVVKLGGSLIKKGKGIVRRLKNYAEERGDLTIILIPGGGPFAEAVRTLQKELSISDETAHWLAVLATHQYGFFLADGGVVPLVECVDEGGPALRIFLPLKILRADNCLPHSWAVTSDTIAAFVAKRVGEKAFVKLTDVDGVLDEQGRLLKRVRAEELVGKGCGCVDAELPRFLVQNKMSCVLVNGNFPSRIIDALEGRETVCTKINH